MPVIGMPGCARSARLNGFDWVLQLVLAGLQLDDDEIADMAIGGLLMEIASRPLPRRMVERRQPGNVVIGGVLLAAGMSRRMGASNKLLVEIDGVPMVRHAAMAMLEGGIAIWLSSPGMNQGLLPPRLTVWRFGLWRMPILMLARRDRWRWASGDGRYGVGRADRAWRHAVYRADLVAEMIRDHSSLGDHEARISFPVFGGKRGNPVLWGGGSFRRCPVLSGDIGGRGILAENPAAVNSISWHDDSILRDIDTNDDLHRERTAEFPLPEPANTCGIMGSEGFHAHPSMWRYILWPMGDIGGESTPYTLAELAAGPIVRPAVAQGTGKQNHQTSNQTKPRTGDQSDAAFQPDRQNRRHHGRQRI